MDDLRDRLVQRLAAEDPYHPVDRPPAPWHSIAVGRLQAEAEAAGYHLVKRASVEVE